jgi:hypothetical protein
MYTGHASIRWEQVSSFLITFLIASAAAIVSLPPKDTNTHSLESAAHQRKAQPIVRPVDTPVPVPPTIIPTPNQGPVGTLVTLQGTGWPAGSQVLISYDSDATCADPNLTELSPDPKPTVNSAGTFSANFLWPTVSALGSWYICAATSDNAAAQNAAFTVLSLSPPSVTITTKGPFMPGQTMTVQGKNWLPGGLYIAFSLRPSKTKTSYPLEEFAISLQNGTFSPTPITIPPYLPPGNYVLVATMEQQALEAQSGVIKIAATPTPTPTATPSPSPTPLITVIPTSSINHQQTPPPAHHLTGTLLALVIISGGMAFSFALIGLALLIYLKRSRPTPLATASLEQYDNTRRTKPTPGE